MDIWVVSKQDKSYLRASSSPSKTSVYERKVKNYNKIPMRKKIDDKGFMNIAGVGFDQKRFSCDLPTVGGL